MRSTTRRAAGLLATLAVFGLIGAACGDDSDSTTAATGTGGAGGSAAAGSQAPSGTDYSTLTGTLNGSGASFPDAFYQEAKTNFAEVAEGVTVNYTKSGSSLGRTDLQNQTVQFAGSDSLPKPEDKPLFKGGEYLLFPTVAAPITVSYNVTGIEKDKLQLSAPTLAKIFQAEITNWNDPLVKADNPDLADLPATPIKVVHRSDGSGTTSNFTKYLKAAAPDAWKLETADLVTWPSSTQGAEKNSGVAQTVKTTDGAVGYVDLSDAVSADLAFAKIKNVDGKFVGPDLKGATAAVAGAEVKDDLSYNPLNAKGADSYPITAPTWIIVYAKQPDAATAGALRGWLNFLLTDGQDMAGDVGFTKLPDELTSKAIAQLDKITP